MTFLQQKLQPSLAEIELQSKPTAPTYMDVEKLVVSVHLPRLSHTFGLQLLCADYADRRSEPCL